ncbi:hypothetical protein RIF29_39230 [Crotalaria pallida]|uniref:Transmembrane protein n=1 Tax=Crotalaria pallida TaxID=3830 RepID=A0AAN9HPF7_CROPI
MTPHMPSFNISPRNPAPMREKDEVNKFRELQDIFDKLFKSVFGIIAFKETNVGQSLFITHPNVMMVMVFMIVLYFLVWLMSTMLQEYLGCLVIVLVLLIIMLVIASISSVLVLNILSSHIAWFTFLLWVFVFAVIGYFCYQVFNKLAVCAVSDTTKLLCEFYKGQGTKLPV